jgi:TonB family protein
MGGKIMNLAALLLIAASLLQSQPRLNSQAGKLRIIHSVVPEYTKAALDARIEGYVVLYFLVSMDGTVSDIKVLKGLGYGLDEKAIECFQQWRLSPGTSQGEPISTHATVEIKFRLPESPAKPADSK